MTKEKQAGNIWIGGFTLMELLVASAVLSIVLSSVYILFHSSIRTWKRLETGTNPEQDARLVMRLISRDVNNIIASAGHLFEGDDKSMVLFTTVEPLNKEAGEGTHLMRIEYRYDRTNKELEREEALVETALPKFPQPGKELDRSRVKLKKKKKFTIANNVEDFEISYIWVPLSEMQNSEEPPEPIEPIKLKKHKLCWWLPQGIEIKFSLKTPDKLNEKTEFVETFPIRAPSAHLTKAQIQKLIDSLE
ncbi:MAG: prepilin-type N-terminal cleavage/methylation domain-containing protein [Candidatus Hydrogenedentes bacterium]|nr:prepilin-type N-terminal cleavage/methylation domain-containing protein [Candidatus Hydrogenedentota bacterium]